MKTTEQKNSALEKEKSNFCGKQTRAVTYRYNLRDKEMAWEKFVDKKCILTKYQMSSDAIICLL